MYLDAFLSCLFVLALLPSNFRLFLLISPFIFFTFDTFPISFSLSSFFRLLARSPCFRDVTPACERWRLDTFLSLRLDSFRLEISSLPASVDLSKYKKMAFTSDKKMSLH